MVSEPQLWLQKRWNWIMSAALVTTMEDTTDSPPRRVNPIVFNNSIRMKLDLNNFIVWRKQVLSTVRGHDIQDFLLGAGKLCGAQRWRIGEYKSVILTVGEARSVTCVLASLINDWRNFVSHGELLRSGRLLRYTSLNKSKLRSLNSKHNWGRRRRMICLWMSIYWRFEI